MTRKFRTAFDKYDSHSVAGERFAVEYSASYDDNGVLVLKPVGKIDVYANIQQDAESCEVYNILRRYQAGDIDVLNKVQGFYDDVSDMPKTYADVLNTYIKTEQFFDSLPVEVKESFNNSFEQFLVSVSEPDFIDRFKPTTYEPPIDEEVNKDE